MEWAGRRSASLAALPWKELGTGPVAFSTLCLWQLLSRGTGPDTAAWHSCPLSLWTVASHTPVEASWTQETYCPCGGNLLPELSWEAWWVGGILPCSVLLSLQHVSLHLDEKQSLHNIKHHTVMNISKLQSHMESAFSHYIIKSRVYIYVDKDPAKKEIYLLMITPHCANTTQNKHLRLWIWIYSDVMSWTAFAAHVYWYVTDNPVAGCSQ